MRVIMESDITFTNDIVYFGVTPQGVQKMYTLLLLCVLCKLLRIEVQNETFMFIRCILNNKLFIIYQHMNE